MKLSLGVIEIPYDNTGKTTGDVAEILETKYHVMGVFGFLHLDDIARDLEDGAAANLENMLMGAPVSADPYAGAMSKIEQRFRDFLSLGEMNKFGFAGIPTAAALAGVNHRLAHPYAKANPSRPSFVDTGLYESSFKAWIADNQ